MPNSYIGVNDVARKITGAYIGVNGTARKITKAYVGDENGKAKLIYTATAPQTVITFNDIIAPTSWTAVTTGTKYTASNTYGTWTITASGYTGVFYCYKAFDYTSSSNWRKSNMESGEYAWVQQTFPVLINPTTIRVRSVYASNAKVQLLKTDDTWLDVQNLTTSGSVAWNNIDCNYNQFFKGIRVYGERYSNDYTYFGIYECYIEKGYAII